MSFLRCLVTACTLSASLHAAEDKMRLVRETDALIPEQERTGLHVPPGFTVQLFASEPMINKPINMAFDARGRKLTWCSSTYRGAIVVIDPNTRDTLFADGTDPIGQVILVGQMPARVVGVAKSSSSGFGADQLNVYAPYTSVMRRLLG